MDIFPYFDKLLPYIALHVSTFTQLHTKFLKKFCHLYCFCAVLVKIDKFSTKKSTYFCIRRMKKFWLLAKVYALGPYCFDFVMWILFLRNFNKFEWVGLQNGVGFRLFLLLMEISKIDYSYSLLSFTFFRQIYLRYHWGNVGDLQLPIFGNPISCTLEEVFKNISNDIQLLHKELLLSCKI